MFMSNCSLRGLVYLRAARHHSVRTGITQRENRPELAICFVNFLHLCNIGHN